MFVHRPRSAPWRLDSALRILELRRDGGVVEADSLNSPSLEIDAAGECAVTFEIDRTLDADGTPPLQAGSYTIACLATLIDAVDTDRSPILRSPRSTSSSNRAARGPDSAIPSWRLDTATLNRAVGASR